MDEAAERCITMNDIKEYPYKPKDKRVMFVMLMLDLIAVSAWHTAITNGRRHLQ